MKTYSDNFVTPEQLQQALQTLETSFKESASANAWAAAKDSKTMRTWIITAVIVNATVVVGGVAWLFSHFQ